MEEQHFDDLARLIAQKTSRRQVLKVLAGAALGGIFASRVDPALAAANCHPDGHHCNSHSHCCSGYCNGGTCGCPPGTTSCGGTCTDTQTDINNCGACGNACSSGQTCTNGTCANPCSSTTCAGCGATCAGSTCSCPAGYVAITTKDNTTTCAKPCTTPLGCNSQLCFNISGGFYCTNGVQAYGYCGGGGGNAACPAGTICDGTYCVGATC